MEKTAGMETCHHSFYHTVRNDLRIFALHFETVSQDEEKGLFFNHFSRLGTYLYRPCILKEK